MKRRFLFACWLWSLAMALPAGADAPPCRYTIANGTVYDARTKLTWQQTVGAGTYAQAQAVSYCTSLPLAGGGWRLPKVSELLTIVDATRFNPAIDPAAFPSTPATYFWSSSAYVGSSGSAWSVYFYNGFSTFHDTGTAYRVRCVR
jgi:hypothetical protein